LLYQKRGITLHNDIKKNISRVAFFLFSLIFILLVYITYIQVVNSDELVNNPLNKRTSVSSNKIQRGSIIDRRGNKLAYSERNDDGHFTRLYPFNEKFAHVVGYENTKLGNTGIEAVYNSYLSGTDNISAKFGAIQKLIKKNNGYDVVLTIDSKLQQIAYDALGNQKGAIVVLNPKNGAILAMVSKPSFNPNLINETWTDIQNNSSALLLNRATQGLYPPGSILKTMILDATLKEHKVTLQDTFDCPGYLKVSDDYTLYESGKVAYGKLNLKEALTVSSNTTFATLALKLGSTKVEDTFKRFGFDKKLGNEDFIESPTVFPNFNELSDGDLCQVGIGQGSLLITPLRMALMTSAFANKGVIMRPHLLNEIRASDGSIIKKYSDEKWLEVTSKENAKIISEFMENVVENGTGRNARISGIRVAGKTGTAENAEENPHAWFIGFAPAEDPELVVVVIVENGGSGGKIAAPIAKKIIVSALK
jgi:peptidoglycan glycosyltransferase